MESIECPQVAFSQRTMAQSQGTIALVGAGPGDPELLTVKARRLVAEADVVISDRLVSQSIKDLVQKPTQLFVARKTPGRQAPAQQEINDWAIESLAAGKKVVRLKIGDPHLFGRGGEEMEFYRTLGFEPVVVPGITSALAAPLQAGIPSTLRGISDRIVIATGMCKEYKRPDIPTYRPKTTVILLMAVGRITTIYKDFVDQGYPDDCAVAIVENATTPLERITHGTCKSITKIALAAKVRPPAVMIIGRVSGIAKSK